MRALGAAIKTQALYPLPHPMASRAVANLLAALRPFMESHGTFVARVTRHALVVGGALFKSDVYANLALFLYTRKISYIKIMPAVSEEALAALVSIVGMDRASLEASGGARQLLRESGVGNIQVVELDLEDGDAPEPFDLNAVFELLSRGRLAPQERERVIEILRAGPAHAGRLIEHVYAMTGVEDLSVDEQTQQIYRLIKSLDRLVLDEPFEDQPELYSSLARAHILVREPLRALLTQALIAREGGDLAGRLLGEHLESEELAELAVGWLSPGEVAEQVRTFLQAVRTDPQKARAVLSLLEVRLHRPEQAPGWLSATVWPQIQPAPRPSQAVASPLEAGSAVGRDEGLPRPEEVPTIDDAGVVRDLMMTMVDVLRHESDEKELVNVADDVIGLLSRLVDYRDFQVLLTTLGHLNAMALAGDGNRRKAAAAILRKVIDGVLFDSLLSAFWEARGTPTESAIRTCFEGLDGHLVAPLVRALAAEPRSPMRAMLCDLLVRVGGKNVEELGALVDDPRWYLVRNVVNVLGRLHSAEAVAHVRRLLNHPDYRVRREAVMALGSIDTEEAQSMLAAFLDDHDERIRIRVMQSLTIPRAWLAMPQLLALLERRDFFNRLFEIKRAALEVLVRLGARQSLPVINRLARTWLVFGHRGRELRRLARIAAGIIEGQRSPQDRALLSSGRGGD
ncbi:MAG TPA: HEAT repeat domain-containing protein [bacterium]|nr:HEAT repeat domain-containing protein [bacterium]